MDKELFEQIYAVHGKELPQDRHSFFSQVGMPPRAKVFECFRYAVEWKNFKVRYAAMVKAKEAEKPVVKEEVSGDKD